MSGNRSLDEFAGGEADDGADGGEAAGDEGAGAGRADADELDADEFDPADAAVGDPEGDAADDGDAPVDRETVADEPEGGTDSGPGDVAIDREALEPPASTYAWNPGGGPCAGCGEPVDERWRDGEDLVCAGCKEW